MVRVAAAANAAAIVLGLMAARCAGAVRGVVNATTVSGSAMDRTAAITATIAAAGSAVVDTTVRIHCCMASSRSSDTDTDTVAMVTWITAARDAPVAEAVLDARPAAWAD